MTSLTFFTFYKQPVTQTVRFKALASAGAVLGTILGIVLLTRKKK